MDLGTYHLNSSTESLILPSIAEEVVCKNIASFRMNVLEEQTGIVIDSRHENQLLFS